MVVPTIDSSQMKNSRFITDNINPELGESNSVLIRQTNGNLVEGRVLNRFTTPIVQRVSYKSVTKRHGAKPVRRGGKGRKTHKKRKTNKRRKTHTRRR